MSLYENERSFGASLKPLEVSEYLTFATQIESCVQGYDDEKTADIAHVSNTLFVMRQSARDQKTFDAAMARTLFSTHPNIYNAVSAKIENLNSRRSTSTSEMKSVTPNSPSIDDFAQRFGVRTDSSRD